MRAIGNPNILPGVKGGLDPIGNPATRGELARLLAGPPAGRSALGVRPVSFAGPSLAQSVAAPPPSIGPATPPYSAELAEALMQPNYAPALTNLQALGRVANVGAGVFMDAQNRKADSQNNEYQMQQLARAMALGKSGDYIGAAGVPGLDASARSAFLSAGLRAPAMGTSYDANGVGRYGPLTPGARVTAPQAPQYDNRNVRVGGPGTVDGGDVRDEVWNVRRDPNTGDESLVTAAPRYQPQAPRQPDRYTRNVTVGGEGTVDGPRREETWNIVNDNNGYEYEAGRGPRWEPNTGGGVTETQLRADWEIEQARAEIDRLLGSGKTAAQIMQDAQWVDTQLGATLRTARQAKRGEDQQTYQAWVARLSDSPAPAPNPGGNTAPGFVARVGQVAGDAVNAAFGPQGNAQAIGDVAPMSPERITAGMQDPAQRPAMTQLLVNEARNGLQDGTFENPAEAAEALANAGVDAGTIRQFMAGAAQEREPIDRVMNALPATSPRQLPPVPQAPQVPQTALRPPLASSRAVPVQPPADPKLLDLARTLVGVPGQGGGNAGTDGGNMQPVPSRVIDRMATEFGTDADGFVRRLAAAIQQGAITIGDVKEWGATKGMAPDFAAELEGKIQDALFQASPPRTGYGK